MKTLGLNLNRRTLFLTKPLNPGLSRIIYQLLAYKLRFILLIDILLISTSYQSENSCINQVSTEQFLPVFKTNFSRRLTSVYDSASIRINKCSLEKAELIKTFYSLNGYKPVWTINNSLTGSSFELINLIERSNYYGLNPDDYNISLIHKLKSVLQTKKNYDKQIRLRQDFELLMTDAGFQFMIHLNKGLDFSDTLSTNIDYINSLPEYLFNSLNSNELSDKILDLQPGKIEYIRLQNALMKYLDKVAVNDEVVEIPDPAKKPVKSLINAVRVLINYGYMSEFPKEIDSTYDIALKKFQRFHGLKPDGKLNKGTRKALSKSTRYRYNQIALNLNRLRKEVEYGEHFASVNIPGYKLKIVKESKVQKVFNVIVGKPWTPTPLISSRIEKIIANPYWNVPKSIALNEILPRLKSDSSYLNRNRFKLLDKEQNSIKYSDIDWESASANNFDYLIRQDMSRSNALGIIKFVFPNPYRIYLHDTPNKTLFSNDTRAYSHGCVRLQNPEQFAEYLINENPGNHKNIYIKSLLAKGIHSEIELTEPLDIHIRYLTCEADELNNIYFYNDIYAKDDAQIEILFN